MSRLAKSGRTCPNIARYCQIVGNRGKSRQIGPNIVKYGQILPKLVESRRSKSNQTTPTSLAKPIQIASIRGESRHIGPNIIEFRRIFAKYYQLNSRPSLSNITKRSVIYFRKSLIAIIFNIENSLAQVDLRHIKYIRFIPYRSRFLQSCQISPNRVGSRRI